MNLPNSHFQDFPIEFKEINPSDFPHLEVENNRQKILIEPDDEGYITDAVLDKIVLEGKNTVVINAAVGQGKSYAIIQVLKKYYDEAKVLDQEYLIIVASPFVSLVKQYCNDIHKDADIPENQIYNYGRLGRSPFVPYLGKKVQVVTVNSLLGNPGDDGYKNSNVKRVYLNELINKCKVDDVKVVFIYDEIHDAIHNFKEEYIFNLWKWKDVIHKNFIISATFNEASKVVIEYLAELTDRKIKIIESKRVRYPKKQSDLYLHFNASWNYKYKDEQIAMLVSDLIREGKEIDILSYSKNLADDIIKQKDSVIGQLLLDKYSEINNCTSELVTNQREENEEPANTYSNDMCNVGTNFKTGVSIKKKNHAYVIIMPPRGTRLPFKSRYGIFSNGINSVIQALARQRVKGEIHIVMPNPDQFIFDTLRSTGMSQNQRDVYEEFYKLIQYYKDDKDPVRFIPLNLQKMMLDNFYSEELEGNIFNEREFLKGINRDNLVRLDYPDIKLFTLRHGENYLASRFKLFGGDLSAYITHCAITNQFVNCNFKGFTFKQVMGFEQDKIQWAFDMYTEMFFNDSAFYGFYVNCNDSLFYSEVKNYLFNYYNIKYKKRATVKLVNIKKNKNKHFEVQLLGFIQRYYLGKEYYHRSKFYERGQQVDYEYSRGDYFLDCISHARDIELGEEPVTELNEKRVKAYKLLGLFREKLIASITYYRYGNREFWYIPNAPTNNFFLEEDIAFFNELVENLIESDEFIKSNIFEFERRFKSDILLKTRLLSFYKILRASFLDESSLLDDPKIIVEGSRRKVKIINSIKLLPPPSLIFNFLAPENYKDEVLQEERSTSLDDEMLKELKEAT